MFFTNLKLIRHKQAQIIQISSPNRVSTVCTKSETFHLAEIEEFITMHMTFAPLCTSLASYIKARQGQCAGGGRQRCWQREFLPCECLAEPVADAVAAADADWAEQQQQHPWRCTRLCCLRRGLCNAFRLVSRLALRVSRDFAVKSWPQIMPRNLLNLLKRNLSVKLPRQIHSHTHTDTRAPTVS